MKNTFMKFAAAAVLALSATTASAIPYDFDVDNPEEQGVANGTNAQDILGAQVPLPVLVGGFAFVGGAAVASSDVAYFDGGPGAVLGGIGVCSNTTGANQCSPASDDNVTEGEALALSFGQDSILNSLTMLGTALVGGGDSHAILSNGTFLYSLTGAAGSFMQAATDAAGVWNAGGLNLGNGLIFLAVDDYEFYVHAADVDNGGDNNTVPSVPLPAGGLLLLTGLAGLGIARRRRK